MRPSLSSMRSSTSKASSTYAPTESSRTLSTTSLDKTIDLSYNFKAANPYPTVKPTRTELNKVIGNDNMEPATDLNSIPCAGIRISYGPLAGLMAWRFVVQLDVGEQARFGTHPATIANFILDTGSSCSCIPPSTLQALGYKGSLLPGTEVRLIVQGVRTTCVVASPDEAGRLCSQFLLAGELTLYLDPTLGAPVLYVAEQGADWPKINNILRTVLPNPWTLKGLVRLILSSKSS